MSQNQINENVVVGIKSLSHSAQNTNDLLQRVVEDNVRLVEDNKRLRNDLLEDNKRLRNDLVEDHKRFREDLMSSSSELRYELLPSSIQEQNMTNSNMLIVSTSLICPLEPATSKKKRCYP